MPGKIHRLLHAHKKGHITTNKALHALKDLPYKDIGFAKVDCHRMLRRGFPEVTFGQGKTAEQIIAISKRIVSHDGILLVTRTTEEVYRKLKRVLPKAIFDKNARAIFYRNTKPEKKGGTILVITAGTADIPMGIS